MHKKKGTLIPIGGNEDKGFEDDEIYTLDFIDEGILYHVVKEAGGIAANIVVIPTASSIPIEVGENYLSAFNTLGCTNVTILEKILKQNVLFHSLHMQIALCFLVEINLKSQIRLAVQPFIIF
jgi:cyanophycinase-like exopeptidase